MALVGTRLQRAVAFTGSQIVRVYSVVNQCFQRECYGGMQVFGFLAGFL